MSELDKEQIKKMQKLVRKKIRDIFSGRYPYVPPKPQQKPEMSHYGLSESILEKNEKIKKYKLIKYHIMWIISLIIVIKYPDLKHRLNDIEKFIIVLYWILGFYIYIIFIPRETEIDKKLEQYKTDLYHWQWWTELFPKKKVPAYWFNLTGYEFEKELAEVFIANGYEAHLTPKSNDGGVDIVLKDEFGDKIYVQCKAYKNKAGVAVIRELYGVMQDDNVNYGIVACLGGFTSGAEDFARDKNIKLISVRNIINMIKD